MTRNERNYWYWNILSVQSKMDIEKNFFELDSNDLYFISQISDAIRVKGESGKSPARTLWDRAKQGKPF